MTNQIPNSNLDVGSIANDINLANTKGDGFEDWNAECIAANYAVDAIEACFGDINECQINYHLDSLIICGAKFNIGEAVQIALHTTPSSQCHSIYM